MHSKHKKERAPTAARGFLKGRSPTRWAVPLLVGLFAVSGITAAGALDDSQQQIVALTVNGEANTLFKAYPHKLYRRNAEDGGWAQVPLPPAIEAHRIAAVAAAKRKDVLYLAGAGVGVLRSADGGRTWETRNDGLPSREAMALTVHADQPDTVYVYLAGKGIFRSDDAGKHWKLMDGGPRERLVQFVHSNMPGSMQTGWFFAAAANGVARSMDCFCGWYDAGGLNAEVYAVAYDPKQPQQVYAATEKGFFVSTNGGEEWRRVKSPGRIVTALAVMPSGTLYAASNGRLFRSANGANTWERIDA